MKVLVLISCLCVSVASGLAAANVEELARQFDDPPESARPRTFWFWMNGNVSADGITRDLEAMKRAGVGGFFAYDGSTYLPAGPAAYLQPHWRELMTHAIREANRLGLDAGMQNGPGWSSSGGPWITPERSMQQLVWTETTVRGGGLVDLALARPQANRDYYEDAMVIAFPALPGEPSDWASARKRVILNTLLAQADMAELLVRAGKPRRAFAPVRDAQGEVDVRLWRSPFTTAEIEAARDRKEDWVARIR